MDAIDRQIVALLQERARRSYQDIGSRVALSAPAVKRRVDRLEAAGWGLHGVVSLFCDGRMSAAEVRDAVAPHPEVVAAYTVAGQASAILHLRAADAKHLEEALERIRGAPGVTGTQTQMVISTLFERTTPSS